MASRQAVGLGLATLHEAFPTREITENTGEVWLELFRDVSDVEFVGAVRSACNQPGRTFFPSPGELRAILAPVDLPPDVESIAHAIEKLGAYDPRCGWVYPRAETVRDKMGDAVANAYGYVGPMRLFSANDTTREIASRDFAETLKAEQREGRMLPAPRRPVLTLNPGTA